MTSINFDGFITAVSDIAVSPPDHTKSVGKATVNTLPRKRYADGVETIYLPATTIRGRLRNILTGSLFEIIHKHSGERFRPVDYLFTASGGIKDRKQAGDDDRTVDLERMEHARQKNPIVSLFGAMTMKIAGKAMIGDAVPEEPVAANWLGRTVRAHPLQRTPEISAVMDPEALAQFRKHDNARAEGNVLEDEAEQIRMKLVRLKRAQIVDPDEVAKLEKEMKDKLAASKDAFEIAGGAVNVQQLLGGYEAIPTGTRLKHSMRLRDVSEDEIATFLLGLQLLAFDPVVGAHRATGNGEIGAEYTLSVSAGRSSAKRVGTLKLLPYEALQVNTEDQGIRAAWDKALGMLSAHNLATFDFRDPA